MGKARGVPPPDRDSYIVKFHTGRSSYDHTSNEDPPDPLRTPGPDRVNRVYCIQFHMRQASAAYAAGIRPFEGFSLPDRVPNGTGALWG